MRLATYLGTLSQESQLGRIGDNKENSVAQSSVVLAQLHRAAYLVSITHLTPPPYTLRGPNAWQRPNSTPVN